MAAASDSAYGNWSNPASVYRVRYSLACLREIEFHVSEGFRRIPYGGIEHGGLLFGTHTNDSIQIETFRPIECEHAAGPSFSLSKKDLAGIREQLAAVDTQAEFAGLRPIGIFISHSRRELRVSAEEKDLLASLFPAPWQCLLLVKPVKFKPAQFAFAFRDMPEISSDGLEASVFVLPPSPRSERRQRGEPTVRLETPANSSAERAGSKPEMSGKTRAVRAKSAKSRTRNTQTKLQEAKAASAPKQKPTPAERSKPIAAATVAPPAPLEAMPQQAGSFQGSRALSFSKRHLAGIVAPLCLLSLAACCLSFYWNHLEPPVEVHASAEPGKLLVSWPSSITASAEGALLRITGNQNTRAMALTPAERNSGRVTVPVSSSDTTVELVASYWMHERRGLVRVITNR